MTPAHPDLSVVIGARQARRTIADCLRAITAQARDLRVEIIVADASTDGTAEIVARQFPQVILVRGTAGALVPRLWGLAIAGARAPLIAVTTAQCIPAEDWLAAILREAAAHPECAGFGGPIDAPCGSAALDWALYFARYAAFMPPVGGGRSREIAGDNAAYRRAALEWAWTERGRGFWETLVHHHLRARGEPLYLSPAVRVRAGPAGDAWDVARARFLHGRHFGSTRPATSTAGRVVRALTAPALPPLLLFRIGRRVADHRPDWWCHYLRALPWLFLLLGAWSAGEVGGYLSPRRGGI